MNHKPTLLYTQYKKLNRLIELVDRQQEEGPKEGKQTETDTQKARRKWEAIDQELINIPDPTIQTNAEEWRNLAKKLRNSTRNTIKLEQRHIDRKEIQERIERRIIKFRDKKREVIKNIMRK